MSNAPSSSAAPARPDASVIAGSIEAHRASPEIDIRRHARDKQIELATSFHDRRSIYLDLKFWIGLRSAEAAGHAAHPYGDLLIALRQTVSDGHVFCPISDSCFLEVFKQSDPTTRRKTAELIDELSLGVTIVPSDLRIGTEIAHLLHAARTPEQVFPLDQLVWTKLSNVLGHNTPPVGMFDEHTGRAIEKAFFDHMWTIPLVEMERLIGDAMSTADPGHHERLARTLTQGIEEHAAELKSFKQTYDHELIGVLDLYAGRATDILCDMAPPSLGPRPTKDTDEYKKIERHCLGLLVAAMKTERGKATLRTLHITTCMHAAVRWNKGQRFKANDFFDYQHAAAAVGYCDAFFTEHPLCSALTRSDLALDRLYDCTVVSTPEDALQYVLSVGTA
ncbi:hypothetical protein [Variovorax sp. ZT4R33]|uniref:hypothetical protein n=1 Tax=Variovorax sp. ZT4R33 TaxID=3443743 RepID=UPI003F474C74